MRLSAKILRNVANVNHFGYTDQATIVEGSSNEFHLQLVDLDKLTYGKDSEALPDHPLRYMPAAGATLTATFSSLFEDEEFQISASQPFVDDKSIWRVELTDEQLPKTGNLVLTLVENGNNKRFVVRFAINVELNDNVGGC
jgi:hypothetical protein